MFNLLLDALPAEYEGYLIRTDYRIGIQISQALEDEELEPYEKIGIALSLLYGNGIPPADIAYAGLRWFLNAGLDQAPGRRRYRNRARRGRRHLVFFV